MQSAVYLFIAMLALGAPEALAQAGSTKPAAKAWQEKFDLSKCTLSTTGRAPYFVLEPGFQKTLADKETTLIVTVLDETKTVDGVLTRVVEEKEWKNGELYEIARNYFVLCQETKDVYYFGEDVEFYEKGKVVKTDGTWHSGVKGARYGLIMPGTPKVGMKYYQEIAPDVAMDRAEIIRTNGTCETPAGKFSKCLRVKEGTPLDLTVTEYKSYAPGIGLIKDADMVLIKYGPIEKK
jgi:hypothetical protein